MPENQSSSVANAPVAVVTGASGFIGLRLVERLVAEGEQVVCFVRATSNREPLEGLGARCVTAPLEDEQAMADQLAKALQQSPAVTLYHLAGRTHAPSYEAFCKVNEQGTERLLRAAEQASGQASSSPVVVLVSSLAAAGPSPPEGAHAEGDSPAPVSHYGRSKLAGEQVARRWADRLAISLVRPPLVFGPGDRDGLLLFQALRRFPLHFVPQRQGLPLSAIYVDDLVEALVRVGRKGERLSSDSKAQATGLYYAADPRVTSYAELGEWVAGCLGKSVWVRRGRPQVAWLPAAINDWVGRLRGKAPLFGLDKLREASATGWVCDASKLSEQLGWQVSAPLETHYRTTHAWYVEKGWL